MAKYEVSVTYSDQFITCHDGRVVNRVIFWEGVEADTPEGAERRAAALHAEAHPEDDPSTIEFRCCGLYSPIDEYDYC